MDVPATDQNYVIRFGVTRTVGEFTARGLGHLPRGTNVIVRGERGHEWGVILCTATAQTRTYLGSDTKCGRVVRIASPEDEAKRDQAVAFEKKAFSKCIEFIQERKLQMQLVDVEQVIGGERVIFYYVAEQRIDFRDLVKGLAREFQLRIEMRQIGIRDEAKHLADYGDCGQPVCCNTFLREMPPVSMKMAKIQKATLDPSKVLGRCGRLKCCLRYEYDTYEENRRELPPLGSTVVTRQGTGKVVGHELISRKLKVVYEGVRNILIDEKDIITVVGTKSGKPHSPQQTHSGDGNETEDETHSGSEGDRHGRRHDRSKETHRSKDQGRGDQQDRSQQHGVNQSDNRSGRQKKGNEQGQSQRLKHENGQESRQDKQQHGRQHTQRQGQNQNQQQHQNSGPTGQNRVEEGRERTQGQGSGQDQSGGQIKDGEQDQGPEEHLSRESQQGGHLNNSDQGNSKGPRERRPSRDRRRNRGKRFSQDANEKPHDDRQPPPESPNKPTPEDS